MCYNMVEKFQACFSFIFFSFRFSFVSTQTHVSSLHFHFIVPICLRFSLGHVLQVRYPARYRHYDMVGLFFAYQYLYTNWVPCSAFCFSRIRAVTINSVGVDVINHGFVRKLFVGRPSSTEEVIRALRATGSVHVIA